MNTTLARAAAAAGGIAIAAAFTVSCSQAQDATKEIASSASSIGSSAASAAGSAASSAASAAGSAASSGASAASSAASAAGSAASSGASVASSAVSSVLNGAPTTMNVPGLGEVSLDGPTAEAYQKFGGESALGMPTAQPEKVGDGTVAAFSNGTIFSSPSTGAHLVQGEILRVYNEQDGPDGLLGWPTADETQTGGGPSVVEGGWIAEFQNGMITWTNQGGGSFIETITKN
jgi:uncharacterized protein with LGFP repeats